MPSSDEENGMHYPRDVPAKPPDGPWLEREVDAQRALIHRLKNAPWTPWVRVDRDGSPLEGSEPLQPRLVQHPHASVHALQDGERLVFLVPPPEPQDSRARAQTHFSLSHDHSWFSYDYATGVFSMRAFDREVLRVEGAAEVLNVLREGLAVVVPEDRELSWRAIEQGFVHRQPYKMQCRVIKPTGELRWREVRAEVHQDAQGQACSLLGLIVDVTDLKDTGRMLSLARAALDSASELMFTFGVDGRLLDVNQRARDRLGLDLEPPGARRVEALCPTLDTRRWQEALGETHRGQTLERRGQLARHDGERVEVEMTLRRVSLYGDEVMLLSAIDLTRRLEAERRRGEREALEQLSARVAKRVARADTEELETALEACLADLTTTLGCAQACLYDADQPNNRCVRRLYWWRAGEDTIGLAGHIPLAPMLCEGGSSSALYLNGAALWDNPPLPRLLPKDRCALVMPLVDAQGVIGLLTLVSAANTAVPAPTLGDDPSMTLIVDVLARALHRLNVAQQRQAQERATLELIERLNCTMYRCRADEDWTLDLIGPTCEELLGYSEQALLDAGAPSFRSLFHPDDQERVCAEVRAQLRVSQHFVAEMRVFTREGEERWMWTHGRSVRDAAGRLLSLEGYLFDTDQQKRAERERDELFLLSPDLLAIVDMDTTLQRYNPAWSASLWYTDAELVRLRLSSLIHPDDLPVFELVRQQTTIDSQFFHVETRVRRKDEDWRWISWSGSVRTNEGRVFVVGRDVTDLKIAASERQQIEARLATMQRLEALGVMAGGFAHNFNNLLSTILGAAELLRRKASSVPGVELELDRIAAAAHRGATLAGQVLTFGRRRVADARPIDLNELVQDSLNVLQRVMPVDVRVIRSLRASHAVLGEPALLEQALVHLISNALDAMPNGGDLRVSTETIKPSAIDLRQLGLRPGEFTELRVEDTGKGMDEKTLTQIFDPFFTTKSPGEGTGLGLSVVYGIAEGHGGAVLAHSSPSSGTMVRLLLPAASGAQSAETQAQDAISDEAEPPGRRVMLVEDNEDLRELIVDILSLEDYETTAALTARDALKALQDEPQRADLLITDVVMPDMNGVELARQARLTRPSLRVLFISGYAWKELVDRRHLSPEDNFLRKPFTPNQLLEAAKRALGG
jgi:PAS domain S-box-containing protein